MSFPLRGHCMLKLTEELAIGWSYWSNDLSGDHTGVDVGVGPLNETGLTEVGEILARPYARAVAGTPTSISYALTVSWTPTMATGPTEIWFPDTTTPKVTTHGPLHLGRHDPHALGVSDHRRHPHGHGRSLREAPPVTRPWHADLFPRLHC